jgi:hypothetical protein
MELHRIILPYRKRNTVNFEQGHALAEAIVDTVREPLLVLDHNLRVRCRKSFLLPRFPCEPTGGSGPASIRPRRWPMGYPPAPYRAEDNHFHRRTTGSV